MFRAQHHRRNRASLVPAFTLIEILTVVVILGICGAIIVPQLGGREDLRTASAARQVMADLIYAQNRAISTQQKHYVQFNGNTYTLSTRADDSAALATITHPITKNPYVQALAVAGTPLEFVTIQSANFAGQVSMGFDEFGAPFSFDPASNTMTAMAAIGTIKLTSGTYSMTISVEPYTGDVNSQ